MPRLIPPAFSFISCAVSCLASESKNLIADNRFEVDADENGVPDGWTFGWQYTHSNDRERGLKKQNVCYVRDYLRLISPASVPERKEIDAPLSCFAAPSEREPLAFAIRSTRDLQVVRVTCSDLETESKAVIAQKHISVRPLRYGKKQGQSRWGMFHADVMVVPQEFTASNGPAGGPREGLLEENRKRSQPHRLHGSTGSATQGDWTGREELLPEGDKVVSGDHKMANGSVSAITRSSGAKSPMRLSN